VRSLSTSPESVSTPQWPWSVYSQKQTSVMTTVSGRARLMARTALGTTPESSQALEPTASLCSGMPNRITPRKSPVTVRRSVPGRPSSRALGLTLRRPHVLTLRRQRRPHPRLACPACGEEDPAKLPRFTAKEIPWIRIDACDACRTYLKAVDLSKEPDAEPVVDELASTPLDVIARERGYAKITPNLAGL